MQRLLAQCVSKGIQPHGSSQVPGPSEFQQGSTMLHQGSRKVPLATRFVFEAGSSGFQARFQRGSSKGSSKGSSNTSDIPAKFQQGPSKVQQSSSNGPGRFQQGPARFQQGSARFQQGSSKARRGRSKVLRGSSSVPVFRNMHFAGTMPRPKEETQQNCCWEYLFDMS